MRAMVLNEPKRPLELRDVPKPKPSRGQLLVRVSTCAVCRTDLHVVDGELPNPKLPLILGHQIVGRVEEIGEENSNFAIGDRVGIPWLGWTDGDCAYCRSGRENLCDNARFTGYTVDGGYAEFTCVPAGQVVPFTSALDWATLGAVPEMLQTAYGSLTVGLDAQAGQTILIRGGSSSVGWRQPYWPKGLA